MADPTEGILWLISGGASLAFFAVALVQLMLLRRASGVNATRRWFLVFVLAMVAVVLAAMGAPGTLIGSVVPGAGFGVAGFAFYKAAASQRRVLEAEHVA